MRLPFNKAPGSLCILRLSAIGDICHTLPVIRTIQHVWPDTKITWVIGKLEASLVRGIDAIEFVEFDKSLGLKGYIEFYNTIKNRRFDALLHMQMSIRSSLLNRLISTKIRLGFDRRRAKDLQWLLNNHYIPAHSRQHVLDSLFGFTEAIGINEHTLAWDIPISKEDHAYIDKLAPTNKAFLVISPCSRMSYRNWLSERYAEVADYAVEKYGLQIVLSGGTSAIEIEMTQQIIKRSNSSIINLAGKTTLKQLLALLDKATAVISPDSGPAHLATTVNTPVIGLFACTNPDRARPYLSAKYVVNKYTEAVIAKHGKHPDELNWGLRIRDQGTMDRILVQDVTEKLDLVMADLRRPGISPARSMNK